jgi:large subunit ribosomal protein L5
MVKAKQEKPVKEQKVSKSNKMDNPMRTLRLEKVVLNCGGVEDKLVRSAKLLGILTNRKIKEIISSKRIPAFGVRPGLKTGCMVTIRGEEAKILLKRLFGAVNNKIKKKRIADNHVSFGIKEYLEIPDMEYQRDIGVIGLDVTAVFKRAGKRIQERKIQTAALPKRQAVTPEEIASYLIKLGITVEEPQQYDSK